MEFLLTYLIFYIIIFSSSLVWFEYYIIFKGRQRKKQMCIYVCMYVYMKIIDILTCNILEIRDSILYLMSRIYNTKRINLVLFFFIFSQSMYII